jgi:hypothetical protein
MKEHSLMTNKLLMTGLQSNSGETSWMQCSLGVGFGRLQNQRLLLRRRGVRSWVVVAVQGLQCGNGKRKQGRNDCRCHGG